MEQKEYPFAMIKFINHFSSSAGNLYQVKSEFGQLLIDPGIPIAKIKKALDFKLNSISACLVSHEHKDHCKAIPDIALSGIPCYMLIETAQALKFSGHRLNVIEPLRQFEIDKFKVMPVPINHEDIKTGERVPGVGFLISDGVDKLFFYIDSFYCKYKPVGMTIIALGVNYSKKTMAPDLNSARKKRLYRSHMSLETALKFFRANDLSRVREIHLLHLSRENSNPDYFKSEVQKATGKPVYIANP